jgi:hypothetical protein
MQAACAGPEAAYADLVSKPTYPEPVFYCVSEYHTAKSTYNVQFKVVWRLFLYLDMTADAQRVVGDKHSSDSQAQSMQYYSDCL